MINEFEHLPDLSGADVSPEDLAAWQYTHEKQDYLLSMLNTSGYHDRGRAMMETAINNVGAMAVEKFEKIVLNLTANQIDRISSGLNYNKTSDISWHCRNLRKW